MGKTVLHVKGGCGETGVGQRLCAKCRATLVPGRKVTVWWSKERDPFKGGEEVEIVCWPVCTNGRIEAVLQPDRLNPQIVKQAENPEDRWPVEYLATVAREECVDCYMGVPYADEFDRVHRTKPRRLCARHVPPKYERLPNGSWRCVQYPNLVWRDNNGELGEFIGEVF